MKILAYIIIVLFDRWESVKYVAVVVVCGSISTWLSRVALCTLYARCFFEITSSKYVKNIFAA